jgi:hypothetical protein
MNYCLQTSVDDITQTMTEYGTQYGDRFNPVKGWSKIKQIQKK